MVCQDTVCESGHLLVEINKLKPAYFMRSGTNETGNSFPHCHLFPHRYHLVKVIVGLGGASYSLFGLLLSFILAEK